jgi:DNA-binding GntR family transcriptional regulator
MLISYYVPGGHAADTDDQDDEDTDENPGQGSPAPAPDPRLWVRIADHIRHQITAGTLTPGDRVTITGLARHWGTCRQTCAKALHRLTQQDLLQRYPGHGYIVSRHARHCNGPPS